MNYHRGRNKVSQYAQQKLVSAPDKMQGREPIKIIMRKDIKIKNNIKRYKVQGTTLTGS